MDDLLAPIGRGSSQLAALLVTALLVVAAAVLTVWLNRFLRRYVAHIETRGHLPYEAMLTGVRLAVGTLWLVTVMLVLSLWGVSVGGLWALLVSAAAVIGVGFLAVWTMISNITASVLLTIWRPFHVGQTVEILPENLKGRVVDRNLMFTTLRESSGSTLEVPNNFFFQKMFRVTQSASIPVHGHTHEPSPRARVG